MADRILKPDSGNDLVLQNDDASAKIEINESGAIDATGNTKITHSSNDVANPSVKIQNGGGDAEFLSFYNGTGSTQFGNFRLNNADDGLDLNSVGNLEISTNGTKRIEVDTSGTTTITGTLDVSGATFTTSTAQKQAISSTAFASGTKMLFNQTSAPTGWTKDTSSNNNSALRVVTGTAGTGGSQDFTSAFGATISVAITNDPFQLLDTHLSSHTHGLRVRASSSGTEMGDGFNMGSVSNASGTTGGDTAHTHANTLSGTGSSGATHNLSVKYVDVIIATKD